MTFLKLSTLKFINSLYPHNHGIWRNTGQMLPDDETFFHHLQKAGYLTGHIGKSHYYSHTSELHMKDMEDYMHARGLEYVHETTGPWATCRTDSYMTDEWEKKGVLKAFRDDYEKRKKYPGIAVWPSPLDEDDFMDSYVGRKTVEFIRDYKDDRPFCLFVGFGGPHEPWDAPGIYADMFRPEETPPAILNQDTKDDPHISEKDIQKLRANYYGKISLVDKWFGNILKACDKKGILDDLFIIFWSDHGEMAGDHDRLYKCVFYESAIRVPLMFRWPGNFRENTVSESLAENIDVFPTILEALEIAPSERAKGISLLPILKGEKKEIRETVLSEIDYKGKRKLMIRNKRYKYAVYSTGEGYMLFDLENDPDEQNNLIGKDKEREQTMRDKLLVHKLKTI